MTQRAEGGGKQVIALIGLRGSGKSTVGCALADLLGGECVDTDERITHEAGRSIADIFADEGEDGFRRREREAVAQILASPPAVISVGGGAVLDEGTARHLKSVATVVWLVAPAQLLWKRISADDKTPRSRPPLADRSGPAGLQQLLDERAATYEYVADFVVNTTEESPRNIAETIAQMSKSQDRT